VFRFTTGAPKATFSNSSTYIGKECMSEKRHQRITTHMLFTIFGKKKKKKKEKVLVRTYHTVH